MKVQRWNVFVPLFLALAVLAAACGGGEAGVTEEITEIRETEGKDVEPPDRVDARDVALPGLILDSNSQTWQRLLDAPGGRGAVILFVQPGGPSDRKGLGRGDLVTAVDGVAVANDEHALALLRSNRGEEREVKIKSRANRERDIEIEGEIPRRQPRPFLDVMIDGNPSDPVLRYVRAQTSGAKTADANLKDLEAALKEDSRFVEALAHQGSLIFNQRSTTKDAKKKQEFSARALAAWTNALDINPRHAESLALQSVARTALGGANQGKSDANKALKADPTLPSANHALALANLGLKKPQDAAGPARAAIAGNPHTNLSYYRTLAEAFKGLKRKADCSKTLLAPVPWLEGTKTRALRKEADQLEKEAKENCG